MPGYEIKNIDDMEAIFFGSFKRARAELGITSFGMQVIDMPPNADQYPEHDHANDGQEEVYITMRGRGEIDIEGERFPLDPETMIRVSSGTNRKVYTGDEPIRMLIVGGSRASSTSRRRTEQLGAPDPMAQAQDLNPIAETAAAEDFVRFFAEGWQRPKPEGFLDFFRPRFHPEARLVQPTLPPASGVEEIEERFRDLFSVFPDYLVTVDDWSARGDVVYIGVTHHATVGRRRAEWRGVDRVVLEDGLLVERLAFFDTIESLPSSLLAPRTWPHLVRWSIASARAR